MSFSGIPLQRRGKFTVQTALQVQIGDICTVHRPMCLYTETVSFKEISITKESNYGVTQLQMQLGLQRFPCSTVSCVP